MTTINHWGKWVDSEVPVTGVAQNNRVEFLSEEIDAGTDITLEEYVDDNFEGLESEEVDKAIEDWDSSQDTILIGKWRKDSNGQYEPDPSGEYAAIVGEVYTQVVFSKVTKRCALCSPCYPGQGDLDTPGDFLTYDLPADVYGEAGKQ